MGIKYSEKSHTHTFEIKSKNQKIELIVMEKRDPPRKESLLISRNSKNWWKSL